MKLEVATPPFRSVFSYRGDGLRLHACAFSLAYWWGLGESCEVLPHKVSFLAFYTALCWKGKGSTVSWALPHSRLYILLSGYRRTALCASHVGG